MAERSITRSYYSKISTPIKTATIVNAARFGQFIAAPAVIIGEPGTGIDVDLGGVLYSLVSFFFIAGSICEVLSLSCE